MSNLINPLNTLICCDSKPRLSTPLTHISSQIEQILQLIVRLGRGGGGGVSVADQHAGVGHGGGGALAEGRALHVEDCALEGQAV